MTLPTPTLDRLPRAARPTPHTYTTETAGLTHADGEATARGEAAAYFGTVPHRLIGSRASQQQERTCGAGTTNVGVETTWTFEGLTGPETWAAAETHA